MSRLPLTATVHEAVGQCLRAGDTAIDATVGNGHDTLWLAERVGPAGLVYGFDVQQSALRSASLRLAEAGLESRVQLLAAGHECLEQMLPDEAKGRVRAVLFNLGYLPGSDKACITRPDTTLSALRQALTVLEPGGLLSVLAYTGHAGGRAEADAVTQWLHGLPEDHYRVEAVRNEKSVRPCPELSLVWKR